MEINTFGVIIQFHASWLRFSGEEMDGEEVKALIDECCEPEDEDGCIPYESMK